MGKAWIGLAIGLVTTVIAGAASAKTERLVSREQALALARPTWGTFGIRSISGRTVGATRTRLQQCRRLSERRA